MLLINVMKFELVFFGIFAVVDHLLWQMHETIRNVTIQHLLRTENIEAAVTHIALSIMFRSVTEQSTEVLNPDIVPNTCVDIT